MIGFDLDMTLIDSRPGVGAAYEALSAETGTWIDVDLVVSRLGPPVEHELAHWFPAEDVPALADRYRALYPAVAPQRVEVLPGAHEALAAARSRGRVVVVTAKNRANAVLHVEHLGLQVDEVVGDVWRDGKADVLRRGAAEVYVGDHVHDMEAAVSSGTTGVGVSTGPCSSSDLFGAGAHHVLASLVELPDWLRGRPT
ncbi:haloacid dehalogenase-like hydrolase [Aeromicrobium marinum DSM 15272]|uniref:Haloacid dehalogenase-like hydrolase n=1 Tax=Aeromicrobium marinum DSM 15272 TaxID=585531 RepID=E2SFE3_9ACTN|nr:HAD hydrolase-like protein [Aeromicrobium marinum]EFQ82044.1 haloacid dehalogenase-like hydrolase [Aeromicrobium marinum DSM 15272]